MAGGRTSIAGAAVLALALAASAVSVAHAATLEAVQQRKMLLCGVDQSQPGFAVVDDHQAWSGFNVDYCRAIAAAVLGDPAAVTFVPLSARDRFKALEAGTVDVVMQNTAWTMARDTTFGVTFVAVSFYDGRGFMVPKSLGVDSALQLSGAKICLETGSATAVAVTAWFKAHDMNVIPVAVDDAGKEAAAYQAGQCSVFTGDVAALYAERLTLAKPDDSVVLPEILSKEPYGPLVADNDSRWQAVVRWVHFALLDAEELGVTAANVDQMATDGSSDVRQLLGQEGALGKGIGLDPAWAANVIKAVGNYGEIFNRNLGAGAPLQMARGLNALWNDGGIQFAPPAH